MPLVPGMNPKAEALQKRTHTFFIDVIALCGELGTSDAVTTIRAQLLDSSGATDSNYRAACRARSRREFIAKIGVAIEEADESLGWLESLRDSNLGPKEKLEPLIKEADELTAIFVQSRKTAEANEKKTQEAKKAAQRRTRRRP